MYCTLHNATENDFGVPSAAETLSTLWNIQHFFEATSDSVELFKNIDNLKHFVENKFLGITYKKIMDFF